MKRLLRNVANAANLSEQEQELLATWVQATQSQSVDDYNKAHEALQVALDGRLERLVIVAPMKTWDQRIINVLLLKPVYDKFSKVKSTWGNTLPPLPLHYPVEILAGVGPYSEGGHMVLLTSSLSLNGAAENTPIGLEFMNVWRARLSVALPWLVQLSDGPLSNTLLTLAADQERIDTAVLSSILCHEAGHVVGQLPIFASEDKVKALRSLWVKNGTSNESVDVMTAMLSDLSADVAFAKRLSVDSLAVVVTYHLMNLLHCWNMEPYSSLDWKPMRTDPDGLGGAIVALALMNRCENGFITSKTIVTVFDDLSHLVSETIAALEDGRTGEVLRLAGNGLNSEVLRLLTLPVADSSPVFADSLCKEIDVKPFSELAEALGA